MASLTALDMMVLVLVVGGAILGLMRGFTSEVISLGTWIVAILALKFFYTPVAAFLAPKVGTGSAGAILTFALVFGIVLIAGKLVAASIGSRIRGSALSGLDRMLGLGFGALKGLVVATIGFLLINLAHDTLFGGNSERPIWITQSRSHVLLDASSRAIVDFVEARRHRKGDGSKEAGNTVST
jgi:membrane protein required for colicin V production